MADISALKFNDTIYTLKDASSARTIDLSIDTTTYVLTATLKDASGTVISTSTGIDLPLETMVVDGEYVSDDPTYGNAIKLELKNGTYVTFPIGGLISGLQSEITANNKLSSDLVDDTASVNKFVTAADKTAWNAKSDFSGSYNDLTDKPTIPTPVTVDQTYDGTSANAQSGVAIEGKKPGLKTTGTKYKIDVQTAIIAAVGAEVFNDYTDNKAAGLYSRAEGRRTIAYGNYSHVQGKYNVADLSGTYAFIIGNGTADDARHNAFAIDWNGLIYVNGSTTGVDVSQLTPVTVDQTYDATSTNAQSGVAIAGVIGDINTVLEEVL